LLLPTSSSSRRWEWWLQLKGCLCFYLLLPLLLLLELFLVLLVGA
jgi:hypothetical protein